MVLSGERGVRGKSPSGAKAAVEKKQNKTKEQSEVTAINSQRSYLLESEHGGLGRDFRKGAAIHAVSDELCSRISRRKINPFFLAGSPGRGLLQTAEPG